MNAFHFGQQIAEKLAAGPVVTPTQPQSWWQWAGNKILGSGTPAASKNINSYTSQRNAELAQYGAPKPAPRMSTATQIRR